MKVRQNVNDVDQPRGELQQNTEEKGDGDYLDEVSGTKSL